MAVHERLFAFAVSTRYHALAHLKNALRFAISPNPRPADPDISPCENSVDPNQLVSDKAV